MCLTTFTELGEVLRRDRQRVQGFHHRLRALGPRRLCDIDAVWSDSGRSQRPGPESLEDCTRRRAEELVGAHIFRQHSLYVPPRSL